ncbi:MAG TPA: LLM class flavin-dependent oxidoreductase [Blastocatellia bacterium]|jgi:F420-dependent oxidoreductase-like protein|nr:LLM class flavin-dependent oxidoreductase [Blastocatellia bacterium]
MRRLGLYLGRLPGFDKRGLDRRELIECVRAAEACGYDSFWMPEAWEREAFAVLTELATRTSRIGLGTGIVNVFSRSPALLAMSAATLDDISEGRFRLGLGTSGARVVEDFHGSPFNRPLTRLKETIQIVRLLLSGEPADFEGECFKLERFKLGFKPLRPDIPIYVAALSPNSLRQLGETADGWLPTHWPRAHLSEGLREIVAGAARAGRDAGRIEAAPFVNVIVDDDASRARNAARFPLAYYIGGMGRYYHASLSRLGFSAEADRIREAWQAGRPRDAIKAVTDELIDQVAICGPLESCRAKLDEMYETGATLPLIPIPAEGSLAEKRRVIEALMARP